MTASNKKKDDKPLMDRFSLLSTLCHVLTLLGQAFLGLQVPPAGGQLHWGTMVWNPLVQPQTKQEGHQVEDHDDSSFVLLKFVAPRPRIWFLRQYPFLFPSSRNAASALLPPKQQQQHNKNRPFLVLVTETILECFEKDEPKQAADESDPDPNNAEQHKTTLFLHRSLELLLDILTVRAQKGRSSSSQNDEKHPHVGNGSFLLPVMAAFYLQATHFTLRCQRAMNKTTAKGPGFSLVQQLLQRIEQFILLQQNALPFLNPKSPDLIRMPNDKATLQQRYYHRASAFQKLCHRYYYRPEGGGILDDVIFAGLGQLCGPHCKPFLTRPRPVWKRRDCDVWSINWDCWTKRIRRRNSPRCIKIETLS